MNSSVSELTETLGFYEKKAKEQRDKRSVSDLSLLRFVRAELTRGYFLEHNEAKYTERRERVYTCLRIPKELEKLMIFGFFLCLDAFLYVFTLLPLRVLLALVRLLTLPCCGLSGSRLLQPAQVCDVLKGFIMVLCYSMMHYVDYSMMYHLIRGQSVIKLYIIYNMLEVADRLFSSFGQDILDALYWTATEPKEKKRAHIGVIPHFLMAVLYVFLHAILIMVQATTLNVAFNSHNKSLLTIMMSNNFVEIKGSVFKKFEKNNLFQMSNSDIKERFTNYVLLLIVCLRNMEQFSWNPDHLWVLLPDVFMVIASEMAVDVVKHAFITKFNDIPADVYSEYRASLAFDLASSRQKNAYTDYSDSVSRRMGFIPLPLALLLIRVVTSSVKIQGALSVVCVLLFYFGRARRRGLISVSYKSTRPADGETHARSPEQRVGSVPHDTGRVRRQDHHAGRDGTHPPSSKERPSRDRSFHDLREPNRLTLNYLIVKILQQNTKGIKPDELHKPENIVLTLQAIYYEIGFIVLAALGVVFVLLMPLVGLFFCLCRCCENCGGEMHQRHRKNADCQRGFYTFSLITSSVFIALGVLVAYTGNHNITSQIKNTKQLVRSNIQDLKSLASYTPMQIDYLTAQYTTAKNKVLSDLDNIGPLLGRQIHNQLDRDVMPALDNVLRMTAAMRDTKEALENVSTSLETLQEASTKLRRSLQLERTSLSNTLNDPACQIGNATHTCNSIRATLNRLVVSANFNELADVSPHLANLETVMETDLSYIVQKGYSAFNDTSRIVSEQTRDIMA
ncbi:transmembrane anterior posterior transformation protein 1, partial [Clarias magur]